jgi:hypothetical protein
MNEQQAQKLMQAGVISNYAVNAETGEVEVKAPMEGEIPPSWPAVNKRSK